MLKMREKHNFLTLISGDLNSRTGSQNYCYINEDPNVIDETETVFLRLSEDKFTNDFGLMLLDFCDNFDMVILNGLKQMLFDGSYTYVCKRGASTVDYFLISIELLQSGFIESLSVVDCNESDHFPVGLKWGGSIFAREKGNAETTSTKIVDTCKWKKENEPLFLENLQILQENLLKALEVLNFDIDTALEIFVLSFQCANNCMRKRYYTNENVRDADWFDEECKIAKKLCREKLSIFRNTRLPDDRTEYVIASNNYSQIKNHKRREFRKREITLLASNMSNNHIFWSGVRKLGCGNCTNQPSRRICMAEWVDHFKNSVLANNSTDTVLEEDYNIFENYDHVLNSCIIEEEVTWAIHDLNSGKACGADGISAEMLKCGLEAAVPFLTKLFNIMFSKGIYPKEWAKAIIIPIFKRGNVHNADNYRGVSLLSIVSKCYTKILNRRLYE
jgi:hypothetical protein